MKQMCMLFIQHFFTLKGAKDLVNIQRFSFVLQEIRNVYT